MYYGGIDNMINDGLFTSNNQTWGTPQKLYDMLNKEFMFTIDLCADPSNYKHERYYRIRDNALVQSWDNEIAFCNPPYVDIAEFVKKGYCAKGGIVVMLIPARTDTRYWHDYVMKAREIRLIKGRLKFENSNREPGNTAPFPSAIIVFDGKDHNPIVTSYLVR